MSERLPVSEGQDYMPLRVMAIDDELERSVRAGARQLVILGAGLDTRAHRLALLRDVSVFEVDHPATQRYKRPRASKLPRCAESLAYVPVDFERDELSPRLAAAGYDARRPTVWIWEGVVMYLSDAALRSTLRSIRQESAPGSTLLVHYHEPDGSRGRHAINALLALWQEPQIGPRSRATMRDELQSAGFHVERDSGASDWAERAGVPAPTASRGRIMRLAVATATA